MTGIRLNAIVLDWGRAFQFWAPPISTVPVKTAEVIVLLERESPLRAVAWNWSNYSRFSATQTRAGRNPPLSPFCERGRLVLRAEIRFANGGDWRCGPRFVLRKGEIGVAGRDSFCERGRLGLRAEIRFAKGGVQCPEPTIERQCPRDRLDWRFCCVFTGDVIPAKPNSLCFGSGRASHLHRLVTVHPLGVGAVVEADVVAGLFHGQVGERGADAAAAVGDHRVLVGYAGFS